jgi:sorbose reductase
MFSAPGSTNDPATSVFPRMELSDKSNPLTRPHTPLPSDLTPAENAVKRFSVKGNAVGACIRVWCADLGIE